MARSKQTTAKQTVPKKTTTKKGGKKAKATKKAPAKAKKTTKVEVAKISRPRVMNKQTFEEYMDSVIAHFEGRRDQVKEFYEDKKCPNACVQYQNAFLRELEIIKKRVSKKLVAKRRNTGNHNNGALVAPRPISKELAKFLGVPANKKLGRAEVNRAITAYIHFDPKKKVDTSTPAKKAAHKNKLKWVASLNPKGEARNLQDAENRSVINPDKKLSKLLGYDDYVKRVKKGKVVWNRKVDGEQTKVVETDPKLNYSVLQHLLAKHFFKNEDGDDAEVVVSEEEATEEIEEVEEIDEVGEEADEVSDEVESSDDEEESE